MFVKEKLQPMLEELKANFESLVSLYEKEKGKNETLSTRLSESEAACESYKKQISELERKVESLNLTEAFMSPGDSSAAAKEKIEKLIKEIDKCISLLEK